MEFKNVLKKYKVLFLSASFGLVCVLVLLFIFISGRNTHENDADSFDFSSGSSEVQVSSTKEKASSSEKLYVDIKGAVKKSGMYQVEANMRVNDVIQLAGGMTEQADNKRVNLAQKVVDQMVIYVPSIGEVAEEGGEILANNPETTADNEEKGQKININTADETKLQEINGIGVKKAQEIIHYREANGSFKSVKELKNVSGIGEKTVEKLKDSVTVGD
jgi:competence protein ComEA